MFLPSPFSHAFFSFLSLLFLPPPVPQDEKEGEYEKWRVENSWGDDRGNKGEDEGGFGGPDPRSPRPRELGLIVLYLCGARFPALHLLRQNGMF